MPTMSPASPNPLPVETVVGVGVAVDMVLLVRFAGGDPPS
jgi:hypothetical protein